MVRRSFINHCVAAFASVSLLCACDEVDGIIGTQSSDVRWEKVCKKRYFYNFLDRSGQAGTTYCGEWQEQCVGKDGAPATGCA